MKLNKILPLGLLSIALLGGCFSTMTPSDEKCSMDAMHYQYSDEVHWLVPNPGEDCYVEEIGGYHQFGEEIVDYEGDDEHEKRSHVTCEICGYRKDLITPTRGSECLKHMTFRTSSDGTHYIIESYEYFKNDYKKEVYFPTTYNNKPVKGIDNLDGQWLSNSYKVIIPDTYEYLGQYFLYDVSTKGFVFIPQSVNQIANGALSNYLGVIYTDYLNEVVSDGLFDSVSYQNMSKVCYNVTKDYEPVVIEGIEYKLNKNSHKAMIVDIVSNDIVTIPNSVTYEGYQGTYVVNEVFNGAGYKSVINGNLSDTSLERVGPYAFYNATISGELKFPSTMKYVEEYAFCYAKLARANFNNGILSISDYAFYKSTANEVILPESLISIGKQAFDDTYVYEVELPIDLEEIGNWAFGVATNVTYNCDALYVIDWCSPFREIQVLLFTDTVSYVPAYLCANAYSLNHVRFKDTIQSIGAYAFYSCKELKNITLPENLLGIHVSAFHGSGITGVIALPSSLTLIDTNAFCNCGNIDNFTFEGTIDELKHIVKDNWNQDNTGWNRYIPTQCKDGSTTTRD